MQTYFDRVLDGVLNRAPMFGSTPETLEFTLIDRLVTELVIERGFSWERASKVAREAVCKVQYARWGGMRAHFAHNEREWASLGEFAPVIVSDIQQARKLAHEAPTGEMGIEDPRWVFDKAWQYVVSYCDAYMHSVPRIQSREEVQITIYFNKAGPAMVRYHHNRWWGFVSLEDAQAKVQELWDAANSPEDWDLWKEAHPYLSPGKQAKKLDRADRTLMKNQKKALLQRKAEIEAELAVVESKLAESPSK